MGPTCSIIYENEPLEKNVMIQKPRPFTTTFFNLKELATSIVQGLIITMGTLFIYQFAVRTGHDENSTRTMVFIVLISSNVFLTMVNRSFYYSVITTAGYKNNLVPLIILITLTLIGLLLFVPPLTEFFEFERLSGVELLITIGVGFLSVIWFEIMKWRNRRVGV
jgi:Ca2+-transporting ATPase